MKNGLKEIKGVSYQKNFSYIQEIMKIEFIRRYYNNLLVEDFRIDNTKE